MATREEMVEDYRQRILSQSIDDCIIEEGEGPNIVLRSSVANGEVNFYDIDDQTVVELRLDRIKDGSSLFFLHFELQDTERAMQLFLQMVDTLEKRRNREVRHVLLCCTCGMTTTYFANKLNEVSIEQDAGYDFQATSVEDAMQRGGDYVAVLIAPQVGHRLREVREALTGVVVIELPATVFGSYDANAAFGILVDALHEARRTAESDLRFVRGYDSTKSVLAVSYVHRADESTISYVAMTEGKERARGMIVRDTFDEDALRDFISTLRLEGYAPQDFDAVGIALPQTMGRESALAGSSEGALAADTAERLSNMWGVPVYLDNNATAAAAGCYVVQQEFDNLVFHAQSIGEIDCEQGYVLDGKPHVGRCGRDGSFAQFAGRFKLSMDLEDAAWRFDGMRELVAHYLGAAICTVAPDAAFVWCDFLPDMDDLREELAQIVPEDSIPELIPISNYDALTLMGEMALCLQRLVTP
ncbi:MAG: hypothetical protein IKG18_05775 [Atopobiaceae bacterium]|nr:hypothetical protein [Atopobiaceae bacterium]